MTAKTKQLLQKLYIAFIVGFLGALITCLEGLSSQPNFDWSRSAVISLIVGALAAGFRAVLALGPINLTQSDQKHSLLKR